MLLCCVRLLFECVLVGVLCVVRRRPRRSEQLQRMIRDIEYCVQCRQQILLLVCELRVELGEREVISHIIEIPRVNTEVTRIDVKTAQ